MNSGPKLGSPKLTILKVQPSGRERINRVSAFFAIPIRLQHYMEPERSTRNMKWKAEPSQPSS